MVEHSVRDAGAAGSSPVVPILLSLSAMKIITQRISRKTKGNGDFIDITGPVASLVAESHLQTGSVLVFVMGSTGGITTFEFEPGLVADMKDLYHHIAPSGKHYYHDDTWGDANGFSHVRASFTGPSLTVPFEKGKLLLGTWQQIVLAEFDNRPREREVIVQITGE
jgi:secondary thiamine-phosphate synthase enzyme